MDKIVCFRHNWKIMSCYGHGKIFQVRVSNFTEKILAHLENIVN